MDRPAFEKLVEKALERLPKKFKKKLRNIMIEIEDRPLQEALDDMGIESGTLFGLYQGVPLTERDTFYSALPDRVLVFRGPILRACESRREVLREIRETVQHELGHYFGMEEEDLPF